MAIHVPVLVEETLGYLDVKPDGVYADLTLGLGGHAKAVLEKLGPDGRLFGFDKDPDAIEAAMKDLQGYGKRAVITHSDFTKAPTLLHEAGVSAIDGFLMDLGVSTLQLKTALRGFGFSADAPLDMRMDPTTGRTAAELLREVDEAELARIIREYGEERWAKVIARRIVARRTGRPIETTAELAEEVKAAIPARYHPPRLHPATRTFQALRIAVNDELARLETALDAMLGLLRTGGRAVVLSYHSLEDRIVKQTFRAWEKGCDCPPDFPKCVCGRTPRLRVLTRRPVVPSEDEITRNPSARSAKLRAAERI